MESRVPIWKNILFSILTLVLFGSLLWSITMAIRAHSLYRYATTDSRGWLKPPHEPDETLGWRPIPNLRSAHTFPFGPSIPMGFDAEGFRTPLDNASRDHARPLVLTLGGSFTYGDACAAEDTFPYKVAQALGGTELNAGVCSYGLAQMLVVAERLIPEYRPDYVLVQYSPWLVKRAMQHLAPTRFSYSPNPYFADSDGDLELRPPVFLQRSVDLSPWNGSERSLFGFASFLLREGLPLYIHDDLSIVSYRIRLLLGMVEKPTADHRAVVRMVYGKIMALCKEYGAQPVIVVLGLGTQLLDIPSHLPENLVVNAHAALVERLPDGADGETYLKIYAHYRGDPPVLVDRHPNSLAHSLIAQSIVEHITSLHPGPAAGEDPAQQ